MQLGLQERDRDVGEPPQQGVPRARLGVHERLGALVVAAGTTLDEVGGEGERRPGETDERDVAELAGEQPDRPCDGTDLVVLEDRQLRDVRRGAHGVGDHRSGPGYDVEVDSRGFERNNDVREQDRSIDSVAAHRLQGDLAHQLGIEAGLEHADVRPDLPVLGKRATGLPHEPHGPVCRLESPRSGEQGRLRELAPRRVLHTRGGADVRVLQAGHRSSFVQGHRSPPMLPRPATPPESARLPRGPGHPV